MKYFLCFWSPVIYDYLYYNGGGLNNDIQWISDIYRVIQDSNYFDTLEEAKEVKEANRLIMCEILQIGITKL